MMKILPFDTISTDAHLLHQLQQNDAQALASLMEKYYQDLYNYAIKFSVHYPHYAFGTSS